MGFKWVRSPEQTINKGLTQYKVKATAAVAKLMELFAPMVETYAKANAPWADRTGNARQTLFTVVDIAHATVRLYLSHGMDYGKWLELRNQGRHAIVMPALEAHYTQVKQALDDLFKD